MDDEQNQPESFVIKQGSKNFQIKVKRLATKHEKILKYIEELPVGWKISVRQIAKDLNVSEGTAYRAIKEAESRGYVSTIERVGTIRIQQKRKENIEKLTFAEVVNIVEGQVLGGKGGLHKTLNKFVIGAMEVDAMMRYTEAGNLLIVGNRTKAQEYALRAGAAVLITGGFDTEERVKRLANELDLPVISTSYDTFTVATIINRAIFDQLIKKEILLVEDILIPKEKSFYLRDGDRVERWFELNKQSNHTRFPVIDDNGKVVGVVTSKDVLNADRKTKIEKIMSKQPITTNAKTSVAAASHKMIWEGIEILPVVDEDNRFQGLISRQDVLKALHTNQRQPHVGERIDDIIASQLELADQEKGEFVYKFTITPQMTNVHGSLSTSVLTSVIVESANRVLHLTKKRDIIVESLTTYFIKPIQLDQTIEVQPKILELGRKFGKMEVEVFHEGMIVSKAVMMFQIIDR